MNRERWAQPILLLYLGATTVASAMNSSLARGSAATTAAMNADKIEKVVESGVNGAMEYGESIKWELPKNPSNFDPGVDSVMSGQFEQNMRWKLSHSTKIEYHSGHAYDFLSPYNPLHHSDHYQLFWRPGSGGWIKYESFLPGTIVEVPS